MLSGDEVPEPWYDFLKELDTGATSIVFLECIGGFVVTMLYGMSRSTGDLDVVEIMKFLHFQGPSVWYFNKSGSIWMLSFGFVSGHDFSRAVKEGKRIGLQPLQWQSCTKCIAHLWFRTPSKATMRAKRVMSANLPRTETEGNRYHLDALDIEDFTASHAR